MKFSTRLYVGLLSIVVSFLAIFYWLTITLAKIQEEIANLTKMPELQAQLGTFSIAHYEWAEALLVGTILEGKEFTKAIDPTKCALGKWYYSYQPPKEFEEVYKKIEEPHRHFHATAKKIIAAVKNGNSQQALDIYHQETVPFLDQTRNALTDFRVSVANYINTKMPETVEHLKFLRNLIILVFVVLLLILSVTLTIFVIRPFKRNINQAIYVAESISKGDFSAFK